MNTAGNGQEVHGGRDEVCMEPPSRAVGTCGANYFVLLLIGQEYRRRLRQQTGMDHATRSKTAVYFKGSRARVVPVEIFSAPAYAATRSFPEVCLSSDVFRKDLEASVTTSARGVCALESQIRPYN